MPETSPASKNYRALSEAGDGSSPMVVYTTFPNDDVARTVARELVAARLAACVNLLPGMVAIYEWQGSVHEDGEVAAFIKTTRAHVPSLFERIRELHPYEVPALAAWDLRAGSPSYLDWIGSQTS